MKLKDKVIVLTGGFGLIGKAILLKLKEEGAFVINADILAQDTADFSSMNLDITCEKSVHDLFVSIFQKFGKIDGLVNNAYPRTSDWGNKFENINIDSWKKNIDFQLNSYFLVSQTALKFMKEKKSGSIVNISSIYGVVGPDFTIYDGTEMTMPAAYSAIKGGLVNLTRYLASYFGPYNIRINCVSPGGVLDGQPNTFIENYNKKVPMKRMATPNDISPSVAFLLSDESTYITGQNLIIDGGWTCI
jgi:NAD(P)-dependent dehydrogenase (short-subunit alcohol dehydrogenase family)